MKKILVTAALLAIFGSVDSIAYEPYESEKANHDIFGIDKSITDKNHNIKDSDIKNNNVKGNDIKDENIKDNDIKNSNIKGYDIEDNGIKDHNTKDENIKDDKDNNIKDYDIEDRDIKGHDIRDENIKDDKDSDIKDYDIEDDLNDYELFNDNHQKLYDNDSKLIDDEKNTKDKKNTKKKGNNESVNNKKLKKKKNINEYEDAEIRKQRSSNDDNILHDEQEKQIQLSGSTKAASEWKNLNSEQSLLNQWPFYRNAIEFIEVRDYDENNSHLPKVTSLNDYYKQVFYCIRDNDVFGLRAIIYKLETLGVNVTTILEDLRTQEKGDNLLLYATRQGSIDVVRFLLAIGSKADINNNHLETPLDIAVKNKRADIVNAIVEMQ